MHGQVLKCLKCSGPLNPDAPGDELFYDNVFCSVDCARSDWRDISQIPNEFWNTDLNRLECKSQIAAVEKWLKEQRAHEAKPGLLLHGKQSGTGKTRLGTYAFNTLVVGSWPGRIEHEREFKNGGDVHAGRWFNVNRFREHYRRILKDEEAKAEWQSELSNASRLFIDDIDKLKPAEGLLELLFGILDERLSCDRGTILTTNFCGSELEQKWGEEYGPYLVRRLREFCLCVHFDKSNEQSNVIQIPQSA